MAFPASQQTADSALKTISEYAVRLSSAVQDLRNRSAAGNTNRRDYVALQIQITRVLAVWDVAQAVPGVVQYARDQYNDQTLDIIVEYTAMRAAAVTLRQWIFDNLPKDVGSGAALLDVYALDGTITPLTVSSGAASGFRTAADEFLVTVN